MLDNVVVIPTYQPEEKLIKIMEELKKSFSKILVVDDGSGEEYSLIFNEIREKNLAMVISHVANQGKGRALKTAFNYCLDSGLICEGDGGGCITVDGDGQHQTKDVIAVAKKMVETNAFVLGCRLFDAENIPFRSRWGNRISRVVYRWACGIKVSDTQTGLRGIPSYFLPQACGIAGERYEYETNFLIEATQRNVPFEEVVIETVYEDGNKCSHFNPLFDSMKIYWIIIKYSFSSILSVIIDYIAFAIFNALGVPILFCTYLARIFSAFFNYQMNRTMVFKSEKAYGVQFAKYVLLVFFSGTIAGVLIQFLATRLMVPALVGKIIVETILFFFNYYIQRVFVFNEKN